MRPGGILSLDLSSRVGWAYGSPGCSLPEKWGLWLLPQRELGARLSAFRSVYNRALEYLQPALVFVEAPLPLQGQTRDDVARQQYGLAAYAAGEASAYGVPISERSAYDIRKAVIGLTRGKGGKPKRPRPGAVGDLVGYPNRTEIKQLVIRWAQSAGLEVSDDNVADACCGYAYAANRQLGGLARRQHERMTA